MTYLLTLPLVFFSILSLAQTPTSDNLVVEMFFVTAEGESQSAGTVEVSQSPYGLVFTPNLKGLPPGLHGFHIHENPSCEPKKQGDKKVAALGAGGHFDPQNTNHHGFPWGDGHLGDLPALYVDPQGNTPNPVLAPRLKQLSSIKQRALMIHAGGDNYSDNPTKLGGGGARILCGVIK